MYVEVVHEDLRVAPGAAAAGAAAGLLINCRTWTRRYDELVLREKEGSRCDAQAVAL